MWLSKNWRSVAVVVACTLTGVLLTRYCTKQPERVLITSTDSLIGENVALQAKYEHFYDSMEVVVASKEKVVQVLSNNIKAISYKYELLRKAKPNVDTVVKTHVVYEGQECIEKLPMCEAQVQVLISEVGDLKEVVLAKTTQNNALQGQFDRAMQINSAQEVENKKLTRKKNWMKVGLITETIVLLGAVTFFAIK